MSSAAGRDSDKFQLRLPDGMRDRIKAAAEANGRSMNAEIVSTLEDKYPAPARFRLDELFHYVLLAHPDEEQETRLAEAKEVLRHRGVAMQLRLSDERDEHGRRRLVMMAA